MSTVESEDWEQVRKRLERVSSTIEKGFVLSPDERKRILQARSGVLAREPAARQEEQEMVDVVEFTLGDEIYCVPSEFVQGVLPLKEMTPVPGTPRFLAGIINVRGNIVAVLDIKRLFDLPERGIADAHRVILVRHDGADAGLLADTLTGTRRMPLADIQSPLPTLTPAGVEYIQGVTRDSRVILNIARMFSDDALTLNEE
jgi:purine-binding chemotaxis protein CheW